MSIFSKRVIGLDISDNTIEVVLVDDGKKQLISKNRKKIPEGIISKGQVIDEEALLREIGDLFKSAKPEPINGKEVVLILPESKVFLHTFVLDEETDLESQLRSEALQNFPIDEKKIIYNHKITQQKDHKEVILIAAEKDYLSNWNTLLSKINLDVTFFDPEPLAVFRSLFSKNISKPVCVIDLGSNKTSTSIFDSTGLRYSYSSDIAGFYLDNIISEKLNIDRIEAKEKKESVNLKEDNDLTKIILAEIDKLTDEIVKTSDYLRDRGINKIDKIILVGGMSQMKGLVGIIENKLKTKIEIGKSKIADKQIPLEYITATGASLLGADNSFKQKNISFSVDQLDKKTYSNPKIEKVEKREDIKRKPKENKEKQSEKQSSTKISLIILIPILVLVALFLVVIIFVKDKEVKIVYDGTSNQVSESEFTKRLRLELPVAVSKSEYDDSIIEGGIVESQVLFVDTYEDTLNASQKEVSKNLDDNFVLWEDVIESPSNEDIDRLSVVSFKWLVLNQNSLEKIAEQKIRDMIGNQKINLGKIDQIRSSESENIDILTLTLEVQVSSDQEIEVATSTTTESGGE